MTELKGYVTYIPQNYKKNYVIFDMQNIDDRKSYTCEYEGFLPIRQGDFLTGIAQQYNKKYKFLSKPLVFIPTTEESIQTCFVKALNKFGKTKAKKLYKNILENILQNKNSDDKEHPELVEEYLNDLTRLDNHHFELFFLKEKETAKLISWWEKNNSLRKLYLLGLNNKEIRGSRIPPSQLFEQLIKNPFKVISISLEKAESIALQIDGKVKKAEYDCGAIIRKLDNFTKKKGWIGTPLTYLQKVFPKLNFYKRSLTDRYDVIFDDDLVYNEEPYNIESTVIDIINGYILNTLKLRKILSDSQEENSSEGIIVGEDCHPYIPINKALTKEQQEAARGALNSYISIITGGAGTGKSFTICEIYNNILQFDKRVCLSAYTGKAVSRLREITGSDECCTLDRLIFSGQVPKESRFNYLIIDEASMVTTELMYRLFKTFTHDFRIVLVGDINQLPPIGWGCFYEQLFLTNRVPIYRLTQNFRIKQLANSNELGILKNANMIINNPEKKNLHFENGEGFYTLRGDIQTVGTLIEQLKDKGHSDREITVLTPFNKYIPPIVLQHQKIFLEDNEMFEDCKGTLWVVGDRVMQNTNNYHINKMNGEEGIIVKVSDEGVEVRFNDCENYFYTHVSNIDNTADDKFLDSGMEPEEEEELKTDQLLHSFCKTVHKSQGSEYPYVIFYLGDIANPFLTKNLIYTGITRAQHKIWIIGESSVLETAAKREMPLRYEKLGMRLREMKTSEEHILDEETVNYEVDDGRINGGLTVENIEQFDGGYYDYENDMPPEMAEYYGF